MNKVKMKDAFSSKEIHVKSQTEFDEIFDSKLTLFEVKQEVINSLKFSSIFNSFLAF